MCVVLSYGLRSTTWAVCVVPFGPPLCTTTMTGSGQSDCKISWTPFKLRCVPLSPPGWNNVSSGNLVSAVTSAPVTNMHVVDAHEHVSMCVCVRVLPTLACVCVLGGGFLLYSFSCIPP